MRLSWQHLARTARTSFSYTQGNQTPGQTIYLTHVKWVTGKVQLEKYFSRFGRVEHVTMFFDPQTGLHRGFASVTFDSKEGARKAMEERPHVIDGDRVDVEPYIPQMKKKRADYEI